MNSTMELDKALRDFAYAVPEDVRHAALMVVDDLAAMTKRAERAEADNAVWRQAAQAAVVLLRDNENHEACQCGAEDGSNVEAHDTTCPLKFFTPLLADDHPGAAMLERMRALEGFYDACAAYFMHAAATHDDGCPEDDTCECPHVIRVNEAFNDLKGMS